MTCARSYYGHELAERIGFYANFFGPPFTLCGPSLPLRKTRGILCARPTLVVLFERIALAKFHITITYTRMCGAHRRATHWPKWSAYLRGTRPEEIQDLDDERGQAG